MSPSVNEIDFVLAALKEGKRLDGREQRQMRPLSMEFMPEPSYGSVYLSLGRTKIFSSVRAEAVAPFSDRPQEGMLDFNCDFSSSAAFFGAQSKVDAGDERETLINRTLDKVLRGSRAIDTEGLCIVASKLVWRIQVTLHVIEDDGNLIDASCFAAICSLLHFRRPDVTVVGDGQRVIIHPVSERHPVPLSVHHIPLCISFSFYGGETQDYVIDPTSIEENVQSGSVMVTMNAHRELCSLAKIGGVALEIDTISHCIDVAFSIIQQLGETIQEAVKADIVARQKSSNQQSVKSRKK